MSLNLSCPQVLRLVTIPISHYCEKARWALERAGLEYREERHVQVIHRIAARRTGGGRTVPVLVTPEGPIGESEDILAWVDGRTPPAHRLFPKNTEERAEVLGVCRRLDETLGPRARRLLYVHMLTDRALLMRFNDQGVPPWEDRALRLGWPAAVRVVRRALGIRPGIEVEDEARVLGELDWVAELLAHGQGYLCGDRFSAADLTFAALSAPVVVPAIYGVRLPEIDALPPAMSEIVSRFRAHPAGRYALRLVTEQRLATVAQL